MGKKIKKNGFVNLYNKYTGRSVEVEQNQFLYFAKIRMYSLKYGVNVADITMAQLDRILHDEW